MALLARAIAGNSCSLFSKIMVPPNRAAAPPASSSQTLSLRTGWAARGRALATASAAVTVCKEHHYDHEIAVNNSAVIATEISRQASPLTCRSAEAGSAKANADTTMRVMAWSLAAVHHEDAPLMSPLRIMNTASKHRQQTEATTAAQLCKDTQVSICRRIIKQCEGRIPSGARPDICLSAVHDCLTRRHGELESRGY